MLLDMLGLALTLLGLALLAAGGYLAARRLLGEEAERDPLLLAIASLLATIAEAVGIGLLLGICGLLRLEWALAAQTLLIAVLGRTGRAAGRGGEAELWRPARQVARRAWEQLRCHPALSLLTLHAVGSEALRGLLRPPLAWDSLMYHLMLTASWVQEHNLAPVFGPYPVNDFGYVPDNGSIWLWWWMAPSHSELYVNLASVAHWVLLGLVVGAAARQLGARRHWPLASYLVLLTPTVVRFVATQYVDVLVGATLLAGCFFFVRWIERARTLDAVFAGVGCGLACGTKILGPPYAAALAAAAVLLVPWAGARWGRRVPQLAAAALAAFALGGFFYVRNIALGAGPLALACEGREGPATPQAVPPPTAGQLAPPRPAGQLPAAAATLPAEPARQPQPVPASPPTGGPAGPREQQQPAGPPTPPAQAVSAQAAPAASAPQPPAPPPRALPALPRRGSPFDLWSPLGRQLILDSFLGITRPQSIELGLGPQALLLLLAFLALPFGVAAERRRAALLAASQIAFELLFWFLVPYAANLHIFANIRYLIPAAGLAFAGGVAIAEHRGMSDLWLRGIAFALACQSLLQLHAEMPRGVRIAIAAADAIAVAFASSAALRRLARRRAGTFAAAALALALLGAPLLARFRVADRGRALASEWTAHSSSAHLFAGGWSWLDAHGGRDAVDVVGNPGTYFVYPAMGPFLQRQVRYVNVNRANHHNAADYPGCNPRVDPSPQAWLDNLAAEHVRWVLLCRYPEYDFPREATWAEARRDLFAPRYADPTTVIFEFLPATAALRRQAPTGLPDR
jgi:hypothetical protein